jgi:hypothetical protein
LDIVFMLVNSSNVISRQMRTRPMPFGRASIASLAPAVGWRRPLAVVGQFRPFLHRHLSGTTPTIHVEPFDLCRSTERGPVAKSSGRRRWRLRTTCPLHSNRRRLQ